MSPAVGSWLDESSCRSGCLPLPPALSRLLQQQLPQRLQIPRHGCQHYVPCVSQIPPVAATHQAIARLQSADLRFHYGVLPPGLLKLGGRLLTVNSLPPELQKSLADVASGNVRLYTDPRGYHYVLYVRQVLAPEPEPFDAVKNEIAKKVYNDKLTAAVAEWADKLKAYYPVKVYLTDIDQI